MPRRRPARSTEDAIQIRGLDAFRRELRELAELVDGAGIDALNVDVAAMVAERSKRRARRLGGVWRHVADSNSIRSNRSGSVAKVILGGTAKKHGPAWGAEFGARQYRQFGSWRGNQWDNAGFGGGVGYMIHPTIRDDRERIIDGYGDGIMRLARRAFPD